MKPLGLPVRTPRSADIGPLVPVEAEPAQVGDDARLRLASRSIGVGVLDAEDIGAALPAREQPVEQRGARVADVKMAGRTRSKSNAHFFTLRVGPHPHAPVPSRPSVARLCPWRPAR